MISDILKTFSIKDKKILNLLHIVLCISYAICLLGILLLHIYLEKFISFNLFKASIIVFQTGLFSAVSAIMSALVINKYKQ